MIHIALVGDYSPEVIAHRAIPLAISQAAGELGIETEVVWTPTESIDESGLEADGIWCVPASPYRSTQGALNAIRWAREKSIPFLGTCGGFQHAVLEFALNVLEWPDAVHAEMDPSGGRAVIVPLSCGLVEQSGKVRLVPGTKIAEAYGKEWISEEYHCRFGMSPDVREALVANGVQVSAYDENGDVRGIELVNHPFFVATLFQHERAALRGEPVPLTKAFLKAAQQKCSRRMARADGEPIA